MSDLDKRFNLAAADIQAIIAKRKSTWWATSVMEWADVSSILLDRVYRQFHHYDPKQPLENWVNTLVSNKLKSMNRDLVLKTSRPCVAATAYGSCCSFNSGGNGCRWTKTNPKGSGSGIQDSSCWAYAKWEKKKRDRHDILFPVSLDDSGTDNSPISPLHERLPDTSEFVDFEAGKKMIDENIIRRLSKEENKVYSCLYIEHLSIDETVTRLKMKKRNKEDMRSYMIIRGMSLKIREIAKQIVSEQGIAK